MMLVVLAILVLFIPFLYPTCRIGKEQLHISIDHVQWVPDPRGGILTMRISIENRAGCDANAESLQFKIYRLIYSDNTTQDLDVSDTQEIHATIPAGGTVVTNFAFGQPFNAGPRTVLAKITIFEDGSSLEVFDGPIETTTAEPEQPS
jgi:hypothetical protein